MVKQAKQKRLFENCKSFFKKRYQGLFLLERLPSPMQCQTCRTCSTRHVVPDLLCQTVEITLRSARLAKQHFSKTLDSACKIKNKTQNNLKLKIRRITLQCDFSRVKFDKMKYAERIAIEDFQHIGMKYVKRNQKIKRFTSFSRLQLKKKTFLSFDNTNFFLSVALFY